MNNQIYRIKMSDNKSLEFAICDTNELEPFKKNKEIGVCLFGDNTQINGGLNLQELSSLIKYLKDCYEYIEEYNGAA